MKSKSRKGFTIIEILVTLAITLGIAAGVASMFSKGSNQSAQNLKRWQAQLVAESLAEIISSLSAYDFHELLKDKTPNGDGAFILTDADQSWMTYWKSRPGIESVSLEVKIVQPLSPTALTSVPALESLYQYERHISADVTFKRSPTAEPEALPRWTKKLSALSRPSVVSMSLNSYMGCALRADGLLKCWNPSAGILGTNKPTTNFATENYVRFFSAGNSHACASYEAGTVKCWGSNAQFQLARALPLTSSPDPLPVAGLPTEGIHKVVVGNTFSCALTGATGQIYCWGSGYRTSNPHIPLVLPNTSNILDLSAGNTSMALLTSTGTVLRWTTGGTTTPNAPTAVANILSATQISMSSSGRHACARIGDGRVMCWGSDNSYGQLGNGTTTASVATGVVVLKPDSTPLLGVVSVAVGDDHSCAYTTTGSVECWGRNDKFQLGLTGTNTSSYARTVGSLAAGGVFPAGRMAKGIFAGLGNSCALLDNGNSSCWGVAAGGADGSGAAVPRTSLDLCL